MHIGRWLVAALLGASVGWLSFSLLAPPDFRKLVIPLATALGVAAVATVLAYLVVLRGTWPRLADRSRLARALWILGSGVAAGLLILVIPLTLPSPPLPYAPLQHLEIVATGQRNPKAKSSELWVQGLIRPDGSRVAPEEFVLEGRWEIRDGVPLSFRSQPATLRWAGRLRGDAKLRLMSHPWSGIVEITWNGQPRTIDLYADPATSKVIPLRLEGVVTPLKVLGEVTVAGALVVTLGTLLFLVSVWLATRKPRAAATRPGRLSWLWPVLPGVAVWVFALLAFWPGLMSPDSLDQWWELRKAEFHDAHPAIHTMLMWLVTRVWMSPAAIALAQIVALAGVLGWGLSRLRTLGMPFWLVWATAAAFALSPVNYRMVITLWKDIPFSIAMLALVVLLVQIIVTDGQWLRRRMSWLVLGLVVALASLMRHNGIPAAFGALLPLPVFYRRHWWRVGLALATAGACVLLVRGPLYNVVGVKGVVGLSKYRRAALESVSGSTIAHLAAHVAYSTPLEADERALLERIAPLSKWRQYYDPLRRDRLRALTRNPADPEYVKSHRDEISELCERLGRRNPRAVLRHYYWRTSFVWRIAHRHNSYYSRALGNRYEGEILTICSNKQGLEPQPIVPAWREWLGNLSTRLDSQRWFWLTWRPALYLWSFVAGVVVAALRARRWSYLMLLVPVGIHSFFVAWLAPSQDFRYQYPVYLTGLLLAAFLLWSVPPPAVQPRAASPSG
jgi:hypothetical protein